MVNNIIVKDPSLKKQLGIRDVPGHPSLEDNQPERLKVLAEIAEFGGGADDRRRTEAF